MHVALGFVLGLGLSYVIFPFPTPETGDEMGLARFIVTAVVATLGYALGRLLQNNKSQAAQESASSGANGFGAFATETLKQSLFSSQQVSGQYLIDNDEVLHTYHHSDVVWRELWSTARRREAGVPPFGERPYWMPGPAGSPVPLSVLAFRGTGERARVARDPRTPDLALEILAEDPDTTVRGSAAARYR